MPQRNFQTPLYLVAHWQAEAGSGTEQSRGKYVQKTACFLWILSSTIFAVFGHFMSVCDKCVQYTAAEHAYGLCTSGI